MFRLSQMGKSRAINLVESSPLRSLDPRTKLAISLCASLVVMLSLDRLLIFLVGYVVFVAWARLLSVMLRQVWRIKWILLVLFIVDWIFVSSYLAVIVTLRLVLLAGVFTLFFATTKASELGLALESLGVPYRFAFSINLAFQSINLLESEWHAIREAQKARGIEFKASGFRELYRKISELVALTVPAIVLTTRRAWAITEAAYARGFDSPVRQRYYQISMSRVDWLVLAISLGVLIGLFWR